MLVHSPIVIYSKSICENTVSIFQPFQGTPKQSNSDDCGVFSCIIALTLLQNLPYWPFAAEDMPALRRRMLDDILSGTVSKFEAMALMPCVCILLGLLMSSDIYLMP